MKTNKCWRDLNACGIKNIDSMVIGAHANIGPKNSQNPKIHFCWFENTKMWIVVVIWAEPESIPFQSMLNQLIKNKTETSFFHKWLPFFESMQLSVRKNGAGFTSTMRSDRSHNHLCSMAGSHLCGGRSSHSIHQQLLICQCGHW